MRNYTLNDYFIANKTYHAPPSCPWYQWRTVAALGTTSTQLPMDLAQSSCFPETMSAVAYKWLSHSARQIPSRGQAQRTGTRRGLAGVSSCVSSIISPLSERSVCCVPASPPCQNTRLGGRLVASPSLRDLYLEIRRNGGEQMMTRNSEQRSANVRYCSVLYCSLDSELTIVQLNCKFAINYDSSPIRSFAIFSY